jgi:hypothetical protein
VPKIDTTAKSEEVLRSGIFMRRRVLGRGFVDDKILFWHPFSRGSLPRLGWRIALS